MEILEKEVNNISKSLYDCLEDDKILNVTGKININSIPTISLVNLNLNSTNDVIEKLIKEKTPMYSIEKFQVNTIRVRLKYPIKLQTGFSIMNNEKYVVISELSEFYLDIDYFLNDDDIDIYGRFNKFLTEKFL